MIELFCYIVWVYSGQDTKTAEPRANMYHTLHISLFHCCFVALRKRRKRGEEGGCLPWKVAYFRMLSSHSRVFCLFVCLFLFCFYIVVFYFAKTLAETVLLRRYSFPGRKRGQNETDSLTWMQQQWTNSYVREALKHERDVRFPKDFLSKLRRSHLG